MASLLELQRYWCDVRSSSDARGSRYTRLWSDENDADSLARIGLYHLGSLAKHECLVLLGRPGAGKTSEIARIVSGEVTEFSNEYCVAVSCKEIDADVDREILRIPAWRDALQQTKPIRFILDALDEGYLRDARYFAALRLALAILRSEHPNLRLLLACRPAEWDETFGKAVHELWQGQEEPKAFALEPLSTENQRALVQSWGIDTPAELLRWIRRNNFEEFAAWPRSLKWLTDQFSTGETDQITYTELCRRRAMRSFTEEDKRMEEAGRSDRVEAWAHALMLVAATITFCGKMGVSLNATEPACLTLDEMFRAGGLLEMPKKPSLTRVLVREAVRTSDLLEIHGGFHRFQNQSDLEYLAAAMLGSLELEQLVELFGSADDDGEWNVFPQLATTAANLAAQSPIFFDWLMEHDPRVLMRMDFAPKSTVIKGKAINAILAATMEANATATHNEHAHFATLKNPQIAEQLRPWLFDQSRPFAVRQLAFDIAFSCCNQEFWIAFDQLVSAGQDEFLESRLPSVVMQFGHHWPQHRLKALAGLSDNRLAGAAMRALLDQGWKPGSLAPFLREPVGDPVTMYNVLLSRQLPREINIDDVPPLLSTIAAWASVGAHAGETRTLAEALIAKGVAALERDDIRQSLIDFTTTRFKKHEWFFGASDPRSLARLGLDNAEHRRAFLLLLANAKLGDDPEMQHVNVIVPLLPDDYFWLLNELTKTEGDTAVFLARLAQSVVSQLGEEYAEAIDRAYSTSRELRALCPPFEEQSFFAQLRQWRLDADEQRRVMADEYQSRMPHYRYNNEEHLRQALNDCRGNERLESWTDVCHALSHPVSVNDDTALQRGIDIRELSGWLASSDELRAELTLLARTVLLRETTPEPPPRQIPFVFFGLVYALSLHIDRLVMDPELCRSVRPLWIQALLRRGGMYGTSIKDSLAVLTKVVPEIAHTGYEREFRAMWDRDEPIYSELLSGVWSPRVEDALARVLEGSPIQPTSYESGLNMLQQHNRIRATELARVRLLEQAGLPDGPARRAAIAVCLFTINDLWEDAWPYFVADLEAARKLIIECRRWLELPREDKQISAMPIQFISGLHKLMMQIFPPDQGPHRTGTRVGQEDDAYDLQSALKEALEQRGEYKGLKAAFDLYPDLQKLWWVGNSLERAKTNAHALRRIPPNAVEFIRFLATEGGTFVRDNDTLQNAVMASLRRFEKRMHPLVITSLWEGAKPRSEAALQIEITRHLLNDFKKQAIVVNMEVKVEGKQGVDILVVAPPFSVTIEIKQAHGTDKNRPVRESMRLQLRDTYLASSGGTHGIYVVGWYFCPVYRPHGISAMKTIEKARTYFAHQAKQLSIDGFSLTSAVIDCGWKDSITARAKRAKRSKPSKPSK